MLETAAWLAFIVFLPGLWLSGVFLFLHSGLTRRRRVLWSLLLTMVGILAGTVLPLPALRDRFLLLLCLLPLLALVDIRLTRGRRGVFFWFRACSFEVCTVFVAATVTHLVLSCF